MLVRKTKIVCSMGPSCTNPETFKRMVEAGMNVARINFTHATNIECESVLAMVREANQHDNNHIAIMYDTKGPDFRTGPMENGAIELETGRLISIVPEDVEGNVERFTVNYKEALGIINVGNIILIEDGMFKLEVVEKNGHTLICRILIGGTLCNRKGINVPGLDLAIPFLSEKDIEDIKYACHHQGDFIALSFVSNKEEVLSVRDIIVNESSDMKIISKIESISALKNIDGIIDASDGIMVARGDLGVEVPLVDVPIIQKKLIKKCRDKGKFCIVATEMLLSMTKNIRPTRAEVSDVANAVLDGTDAVMLSNETTIGNYPVEAVKVLADTCERVEEHLDYTHPTLPLDQKTTRRTIAYSAVLAANNMDASAILASTLRGNSAMQVSTLRPKAVILAACTTEEAARSLAFNFGVYPCVVPIFNTTDEIIEIAKAKGREVLGLQKGDLVVITGGFPQTKSTNFLKIEEI